MPPINYPNGALEFKSFPCKKGHWDMETLKISLLQIAPCDTLKKNLEKGITSCRKAKELGADIALFPLL